MTTFESKVLITQPAKDIFDFLIDLNNHQGLMPENITDWSSTKDEARFNIQNMAKLALKVESKIEYSEIVIAPFETAPIPLKLTWNLSETGNTTEAKLTISAELNMMMKMLASAPLQKLADYQTAALSQKF